MNLVKYLVAAVLRVLAFVVTYLLILPWMKLDRFLLDQVFQRLVALMDADPFDIARFCLFGAMVMQVLSIAWRFSDRSFASALDVGVYVLSVFSTGYMHGSFRGGLKYGQINHRRWHMLMPRLMMLQGGIVLSLVAAPTSAPAAIYSAAFWLIVIAAYFGSCQRPPPAESWQPLPEAA